MKDTLRIKTNPQQPELTKPEVTPVSKTARSSAPEEQPTTTKPSSPLSFKGGVARYSPFISQFK
jgi:hypothetical protein